MSFRLLSLWHLTNRPASSEKNFGGCYFIAFPAVFLQNPTEVSVCSPLQKAKHLYNFFEKFYKTLLKS